MRIRGDAARLEIDGINPAGIAIRGIVALGAVSCTAWVLVTEGTASPIMLLVCGGALVLLRRGFSQRPRLVLDRAEGEMTLTRGGEEVRRPLSAIREARVQSYEPDPRFRKRAAGRGLARMALLTDKGTLPFELPYRSAARAARLAQAVNGWLGR